MDWRRRVSTVTSYFTGPSSRGADPPSMGSGQSEVSSPSPAYPRGPKTAVPFTSPYHASSTSAKRRLEADKDKELIQDLRDEIALLTKREEENQHRREEENREREEENRKKERENRKKEEEHRKREEEHRKREEEHRKEQEAWRAHCQTQDAKLIHFQDSWNQQQRDIKKLSSTLSKYHSDLQQSVRQEQNLKKELGLERKKFEDYRATTTTEIQQLQQQNQDCQTHIVKMSQIISQLSKRGLPETHDDRYFMEKLDEVAESISQWARLFSRGQPALTVEDLKNTRVSGRVKEYLLSAFSDLMSLLNAKNVGGKVRTRFVEAIMLRTLMGDRLWKRHIGFPEREYESHRNLIQGMNCTEEEIRGWSALTVHRLTKDNENLPAEKEKDIDTITDAVLHDLSPFGGSARATREKLREIVSNVAELGLEMARLPFEIRPLLDLKPGEPFTEDMMKDMDPEEDGVSGKTTIILSYPWVKVAYDGAGKGVLQSTYLSKARVSCIC